MIPRSLQSDFLPDQIRNYRLVRKRWISLIKGLRFLTLRDFHQAGEYSLMLVESNQISESVPSLYISAGIHGDEPAPVEGLLQWACEALPQMKGWNILLFPCLNPWGLERNVRCDANGRDLNRCYQSKKIPQIAAQLTAMQGRTFDLALTLHEDYDARGFYFYEVAGPRPYWGELIRKEISTLMPYDPRSRIEGAMAKRGVIRRRIQSKLIEEINGYPEAFLLHLHHAKRTFTFETPSEDYLVRRVETHKKFIELTVGELPQILP